MLLFYRAKKVSFQPPHLPHKGCSTNICWVNELGFFYFLKNFLCVTLLQTALLTYFVTDAFNIWLFEETELARFYINTIITEAGTFVSSSEMLRENKHVVCAYKDVCILTGSSPDKSGLDTKGWCWLSQKWQTNKNSTTIIHVTKNVRHI